MHVLITTKYRLWQYGTLPDGSEALHTKTTCLSMRLNAYACTCTCLMVQVCHAFRIWNNSLLR
jgi:hypothetical protein